MKELYYLDRERYEFVKKLLGISHEPPKMGVIVAKPTRKGELRRLTREYCDKIKEERLTEYHEELKTKRASLNDEMEKVEQLIKEEEKYLGTINSGPSSSVPSQ